MVNTSDLYDRPGNYKVDHPNSKKKIAKIVAGLLCSAGIFMLTAAPGGVGHYHHSGPSAVHN